MANVNINRRVNDQFYRYKMPRLIAKVEGRGNGIKTVIPNMAEISKALQVPPAYPTRFIGIEVGAQVIIDTSKDRYIVNGSHDCHKLQDVLYDFIEKYLLCPQCDNPETFLKVGAGDTIRVTCTACGYHRRISHSHKFNTYIVKNPPNGGSDAKYKSCNAKNGDGEKDDARDSGGLAEADQPLPQKTEWMSDTSQAAIEQRMSHLPHRIAELTINADLEKKLDDRLQMISELVGKMDCPFGSADVKAIMHESKRLETGEKTVLVVCDRIFQDMNIGKAINQNKDLIQNFTSLNIKAQVYVLHAIERLIVRFPKLACDKVSEVFTLLYSTEIVDEEAFLFWSRKRSARYLKDDSLLDSVHKGAEKFLTWLRTAECETDDSNDIEFDEAEDCPTAVLESSTRNAPPKNETEEEGFNIDDI